MIHRFLDFELDTKIHQLRKAGTPCAIEPQVFDLLLFLIENREQVVSHDELVENVWHGRIVADATIASRIRAVRKVLGDTGVKQEIVQTVPRRGFRFVATLSDPSGATESEPQTDLPSGENFVDQTGKPSIAVLPFDNMSGNPEEDYFSDGLCEDLIMALSQYPGLLVIARNSTFIYKGKAVDIATVARDLNVTHVLEGSVRRGGQRLRITAQLINAGTSAQVWAERYDRDLSDIFAVQDEITLNIVSALGQKLSEGEYATDSRKGTASLDAWRAAVQAMSAFEDTSHAGIERTLEHLREAVRIDPDYAFAWGMIALLHFIRVRYGWSQDEKTELAHGFKAVDRSIEIAPDLYLAYCARGFALAYQGDHAVGVWELRRAAELAPSNAFAKFLLGGILNYCGSSEEAILVLEEARRLDPFHGPWVLGVLAHALRLTGRYAAALDVIAKHQKIRASAGHDDRIIALVEMGQQDAAAQAAIKLLQYYPDFHTEDWAKRQYYDDRERLRRDVEALRSAGLD